MKFFLAAALLLSSVNAQANALPSQEVMTLAEQALENACGEKYLRADAVELSDYSAKKLPVDQGQNDYAHYLTFRFVRDSLPTKYVGVTVNEYAISNPNVARHEVVAVDSAGYCQDL